MSAAQTVVRSRSTRRGRGAQQVGQIPCRVPPSAGSWAVIDRSALAVANRRRPAYCRRGYRVASKGVTAWSTMTDEARCWTPTRMLR